MVVSGTLGATLAGAGYQLSKLWGGLKERLFKPSEGASKGINTSKILDSASAAKKGGETVAGHALQKHAGRNPDIWGKVSGNSANINKTAMQHIDDIMSGPGELRQFKQMVFHFYRRCYQMEEAYVLIWMEHLKDLLTKLDKKGVENSE